MSWRVPKNAMPILFMSRSRLVRDRKQVVNCPEQFPFGPFAEKAERIKKNHCEQTPEVMRSRGGLGFGEALAILKDKHWREVEDEPWFRDDELALLGILEILSEWCWRCGMAKCGLLPGTGAKIYLDFCPTCAAECCECGHPEEDHSGATGSCIHCGPDVGGAIGCSNFHLPEGDRT